MPWQVELSTTLEAPAERVWAEVQKPRLLNYVAHPLIVFKLLTVQAWPEHWEATRYQVQMLALGWLPFGKQWIDISVMDSSESPVRRIRDNGTGDLVKKWDHWIEIEPLANGCTRYTDRVLIEAGWLTPFVWLFAR